MRTFSLSAVVVFALLLHTVDATARPRGSKSTAYFTAQPYSGSAHLNGESAQPGIWYPFGTRLTFYFSDKGFGHYFGIPNEVSMVHYSYEFSSARASGYLGVASTGIMLRYPFYLDDAEKIYLEIRGGAMAGMATGVTSSEESGSNVDSSVVAITYSAPLGVGFYAHGFCFGVEYRFHGILFSYEDEYFNDMAIRLIGRGPTLHIGYGW
jgi:hypothetical protein